MVIQPFLLGTQVNIFLLLFGGLQGLLLSILLIRKKAYRSAYLFLVIYIGVMILQILLKVVSKVWLLEHMQPLYYLSYRFPFLYGPLVYLFTLHVLDSNRRWRIRQWLHVVPFGLSIVAMSLAFIYHERNLFYSVFLDSGIAMWFQLLSVMVYHWLALSIWRRDRRSGKAPEINIYRAQVMWLKQFIVSSFLVCSAMTITIYFMYAYYPQLADLKWVFVSFSIFIYWISFVAINQPQVFSVIRGDAEPANGVRIEPTLTVHRTARRYMNSGLSQDQARRIANDLQKLVTTERPYLDSELTIEQLAGKVDCSRHHLSQVLNESYGKSFYDFVNHLRIQAAKELLSGHAPGKIASTAFDSGFSSISTFNDVFKKITGMTPSQYRKEREGMVGKVISH